VELLGYRADAYLSAKGVELLGYRADAYLSAKAIQWGKSIRTGTETIG